MRYLAAILVLFLMVSGARAEDQPLPRGCLDLAKFEEKIERSFMAFDFDDVDDVKFFVALWHSRPRPPLPAAPQTVVVYDFGHDKPYIVAYARGDCGLALMSVDRLRLNRLLDDAFGYEV